MAAVDDLLACAICLDWFKSPRWLPCHHVYCLQCLKDHVKEETNRITCPECRRDHAMPNNRVEDFPVDGRLEQLVEKHTKPKPESETDWKDCSKTLSTCDHSQPACRECQTYRAQLLESLLQESRQFREDFLTENQRTRRQELKAQLIGQKTNLRNLKVKVVREMEDILKEVEKRKLILLSGIEEEERLLVECQSKLHEVDDICVENEGLPADLVEKVPSIETLVSLRAKLSKQNELMKSVHQFMERSPIEDPQFKRTEIMNMIVSYGDVLRADPFQQVFVTTENPRCNQQ